MKRICDTKEGKTISAFIILNKKGEQVAKVQAHYSDNGYVSCNVWNFKSDEPLQSSRKYGDLIDSLEGLTINGIELKGHCSRDAKTARLASAYFIALDNKVVAIDHTKFQKKADKLGAHFSGVTMYYTSGLDRLVTLGLRVIQAI